MEGVDERWDFISPTKGRMDFNELFSSIMAYIEEKSDVNYNLDDLYRAMKGVDEGVCRGCHTSVRSPHFDYKRYKERIDHKGLW